MPGEMCLENRVSGWGSQEAPRRQTEPPGTGPSERLPSSLASHGQAGAGPFLAMTSYPRDGSSTHWPKLGAARVTRSTGCISGNPSRLSAVQWGAETAVQPWARGGQAQAPSSAPQPLLWQPGAGASGACGTEGHGPGICTSESTQWSWAFFLFTWIFSPVSPKCEFWVKQSMS